MKNRVQRGRGIPCYGMKWQSGGSSVWAGTPYQFGGAYMPVYSGESYQYGEGLGDILRGIGRFLLPIFAPVAARAATSFINNASTGLSEGRNIGDAAKAALLPTIGDTVNEAKDVIVRRAQRGSGKPKPKRRRVYKAKKNMNKTKTRKIIKTNF
jgi:hypothetical protein